MINDYTNSTLPGNGTNNGGSMMDQIPSAVTQAIRPLIRQASGSIMGSVNNTLGTGGGNKHNYFASNSNYQSQPMQLPSNNQPNYTGNSFDSLSSVMNSNPTPASMRGMERFSDGGKIDAQNLASKGRGEDKMLVHMTPSEVDGLQALAMAQGGSLTINPETGLLEAGALSDTFKAFLPTLVGAGIMMIPGVNAAAAPWIGAGLGAVEYARTGDIGAGISAGLGAYGGAGMASGFMGAGAAAGVAPPPPTTIGAAVDFTGKAATTAAPIANSVAPATFSSNLASAGKGVTNLAQPGGVTNFMTAMGGPKSALISGGAAATSIADGYGAFDPEPFNLAKPEEDYDYGGPYEPTPRTARFQSTDDILAGGGREFKYFDDVNPYPNVRPIQAAEGGLMALDSTDALGAADEGRLLEGPGDGVSDSIPATVDGEQPVMLSDGEYIMPAEFVSAIGNGSSDAGAAKLTSLVDRVMANTRKAEKGKPNGADNMLRGLVAPA